MLTNLFTIKPTPYHENCLMRRLFYLPPDLLANPQYKVSEFFLLSGADAEMYLLLESGQGAAIFGDIPFSIIQDCKQIAISERRNLSNQEKYLVYRHWYPSTQAKE